MNLLKLFETYYNKLEEDFVDSLKVEDFPPELSKNVTELNNAVSSLSSTLAGFDTRYKAELLEWPMQSYSVGVSIDNVWQHNYMITDFSKKSVSANGIIRGLDIPKEKSTVDILMDLIDKIRLNLTFINKTEEQVGGSLYSVFAIKKEIDDFQNEASLLDNDSINKKIKEFKGRIAEANKKKASGVGAYDDIINTVLRMCKEKLDLLSRPTADKTPKKLVQKVVTGIDNNGVIHYTRAKWDVLIQRAEEHEKYGTQRKKHISWAVMDDANNIFPSASTAIVYHLIESGQDYDTNDLVVAMKAANKLYDACESGTRFDNRYWWYATSQDIKNNRSNLIENPFGDLKEIEDK